MDENTHYKLADLKTGRKVINWTKCVTCKAKILKQYHEVSVECPHCSGGLNRSRNLVDAFRDKAISRALPRI